MQKLLYTLSIMLLCMACDKAYDHGGRTPLVEVEGNFLYLEDLQSVLPDGLSAEDSLQFVERYVRNWAEDVLLFDKAQRNVPNSDEIKRHVENYRKSLIMHTYQQELIHQQLSDEITEEELMAYYEQHRNLFTLEQPLMKGLFIKVPLKAPQLSNVRRWYKSESQQAVENLEKYSLQHAVKYEYFYDKWVPVPKVMALITPKTESTEKLLKEGKQVELKDTAFHYFLNVTELRSIGEQEPYEFARDKIKEVLLNVKRVDFMKSVKESLYQQAVEKDKIRYYKE